MDELILTMHTAQQFKDEKMLKDRWNFLLSNPFSLSLLFCLTKKYVIEDVSYEMSSLSKSGKIRKRENQTRNKRRKGVN